LTNNYFNEKCDQDYDDNDFYYSAKKNTSTTKNPPIQRNSVVIIKPGSNSVTTTSTTGISSKCNGINLSNDDNTIKSDTACLSSNSTSAGSSNSSTKSNSSSSSSTSSTASSSNSSAISSTASSTSKSSSSDNCNLIDNSGTSSGITSGNSCLSDESDESSIQTSNMNKTENSFPINTIKYNAKTNILQHTSFPAKNFQIKKNDLVITESNQLLKIGNAKNLMKFGMNTNSKLMLDTLLECQTTSFESNRNFNSQSSQNSSIVKEENEYSDEYCYNSHLNEEFSGITLDLDNTTACSNKDHLRNFRANTQNIQSNNLFHP
jgi:hypothetical protein